MVLHQVLVNPHRLQALLDLRQDLFPERLALARGPLGELADPAVTPDGARFGGFRAGGAGLVLLRRRNKVLVAAAVPVGAFGWFWALARATYLPTVSRFTPTRAAISRLECPACMECKDRVDFGHRESVRHRGLLQQRVAEG